MPKVNFTKVDDTSFELIPAGGYLFQIKSVDNSKFDPVTNAEKWKIKMEIISGEHKGGIMWDNWSWFDKGLKRIKYNLRQLGIDVDREVEIFPETIMGRVLYCAISVEKDNRDPLGQKMQNRIPWDGWKSLDKSPDPNEAKKLAEEFEANFKTSGNGQVQGELVANNNIEDDNSDVPF
jgi:hypothetical protein